MQEIKSRAVKVNNGSGVLVTSLDFNYSYVLTAKHNLLEDSQDLNSKILDNEKIIVIKQDGSLVQIISVVFSLTFDAAIILVRNQTISPILVEKAPKLDQQVKLIGYPKTRRSRSDSKDLRVFTGRLEDIDSNIIDISTTTFSSRDQIVGCSGGGVYTQINGSWFLLAIETQMEGLEDEDHHWLSCISIQIFQELLEQEGLAPILPSYLSSFNEMKLDTFIFSGFECKKTLKNVRSVLNNLISNFDGEKGLTPLEIYTYFGVKLLVHGEMEGSLQNKDLWIALLEYLIISYLLDESKYLDIEYVKDLRSKRLFLYSSSQKEWVEFLENIMLSEDLKTLKSGSKVLVSNRREYPPVKVRSSQDLSKLIPDIGMHTENFLDIGTPRTTTPSIDILHLDGIHSECVVKKELQFQNKSALETLKLLKEVYREVIIE